MGNFCAFQFWERMLKVIITHLCALLDLNHTNIFKLFHFNHVSSMSFV